MVYFHLVYLFIWCRVAACNEMAKLKWIRKLLVKHLREREGSIKNERRRGKRSKDGNSESQEGVGEAEQYKCHVDPCSY